jgi:hypothetical protein
MLSSVVCIIRFMRIWSRLMFLSGDTIIQNTELIFALFKGPELYDVYLYITMCMVIMYVMTETRTFWYNPHRMKRITRMLFKYLSRMKLLMLLIKYYNAEKRNNTPTRFKWDQPGPSQTRNYCPIFYSRLKGVGEYAERLHRSLLGVQSEFPD